MQSLGWFLRHCHYSFLAEFTEVNVVFWLLLLVFFSNGTFTDQIQFYQRLFHRDGWQLANTQCRKLIVEDAHKGRQATCSFVLWSRHAENEARHVSIGDFSNWQHLRLWFWLLLFDLLSLLHVFFGCLWEFVTAEHISNMGTKMAKANFC